MSGAIGITGHQPSMKNHHLMQKILLALTLALSASVARAGLDITALSGLTQVAAATLDSDGQPQGEHQVILSPVGFPEPQLFTGATEATTS